MVLAIDAGNSNIVVGGYSGRRLRFMARLATDTRLETDQYAVQLAGILRLHHVDDDAVDDIVMASVVPPLTPVLLGALDYFTKASPRLLSIAAAGDITIDIDRPAELGTDILASAIAVRHHHPLPAVIIDMGTATKITALDANRRLMGVSISPGLHISLQALVSGASALGGIPLEAPACAIGKNTPESMKSGVVLGSAAMLDGMIDRFEAEMGPIATVIATGGAAGVVVPHCRRPVKTSETLLLDGLIEAYERQTL